MENTIMNIRITTLIDMAARAAEGMTDWENVPSDEDAGNAAATIVDYRETEDGLLHTVDQERFDELGGTPADMDEIRGRVIDIIENAIRGARATAKSA